MLQYVILYMELPDTDTAVQQMTVKLEEALEKNKKEGMFANK